MRTIFEATLISAPSSTNYQVRPRHPALGTIKQGGQWLHGMKAHIGLDEKTMLIHTVKAAPRSVADTTILRHVMRGPERRVWGEHAYCGLGRVTNELALEAWDLTQLKRSVNRWLTPPDEMVDDIRAGHALRSSTASASSSASSASRRCSIGGFRTTPTGC